MLKTLDQATAERGQTAVQIIANYFQERYRPLFRDGAIIHCEDGSEASMGAVVSTPNSVVIFRLGLATDAPRNRKGEVDADRLPALFTKWCKVAWGDLLDSLPDEDNAKIGDESPIADIFRRLVRDAMLTEVQFGGVYGGGKGEEVTQVERRSLIDWCQKWAKVGPWRSIRSKQCWTKGIVTEDGEFVVRVAIRHELFAQLRADKRLITIGPKKFARRADRYGVGKAHEGERPHGQRAIILADGFVRDLLDGIADCESEENLPQLHESQEGGLDRQENSEIIGVLKH